MDPVVSPARPDELEVAPGFEKSHLQGAEFSMTCETDLLAVLEKAFDYRGDVTIHLKDGSSLEGYIFDRSFGPTLSQSFIRLFLKKDSTKVSLPCAEVSGLAFSGRDTAAGKSFDAWVKKYWEKKAAGELNIELVPEKLE